MASLSEASEKRPISRCATAGTYYFKRGADFLRATMRMIGKDAHVQGRYFVCPVYNELILEQARIGVVRDPQSAYFSLATPQGVQQYEEYLAPCGAPGHAREGRSSRAYGPRLVRRRLRADAVPHA